MVNPLPVKRGLSSPAVTSIPKEWSQQWFRYFIDNFLTNADIRNIASGTGITVSGNVSGNNTAGTPPNTSVTVSISPIDNNQVLGNISGASAVPIGLTQAQLTALINLFTSGISGAVPASGGGTVNFLRADGTWALPAGSAAIPNNTVLGNVSGILATPVALTQTQLTALVNTFTSLLSGAVPASGGGTVNFLRADGTFAAPPTVSGANPTASVGLIAVNGTATTYLRSDGAPALSQSIVPTWSGVHTFSARPAFNLGATVSGGTFITRGFTDNATATALLLAATGSVSIAAPTATNVALSVNGASTAVALSVISGNSSVTGGADFNILRAGSTINQIGQGPGMVMSDITNLTSTSWQHSGGQTELWQNNSGVVSPTWRQVLKITSSQGIVINAPITGTTLTIAGLANQNTVVINAPTTSGQSFGEVITAGTTSADYTARWLSATGTEFFKVRGDGVIFFSNIGTTTTAPPAGGAGALPATPKGYATFVINNTAQEIPYY